MLTARIAAEISRDGPMPFDRFMEIALYGEGGYFSSGGVRSEKVGDFLTSPEVSPLFGATIARFVASERERVGEPFAVADVGAGTGSLLRPLLDALRPVEAYAVDVSPAARERVATTVPEATTLDTIAALPGSFRGVIVANELLDNLPAAVAIRRVGAWAERVVTTEGGLLVAVEASARPEVSAWADAHSGPVPEGGVVEVQLAAVRWVESALDRLTAGALVVVDYGDTAEGLAGRRQEGTIRTYRGHHLGPDPLLEPGATDITMDVNFSAVVAVATRAGAAVEVYRQDHFLMEWGLRETLVDLRRRERDLARDGDTMGRLGIRSEVTGAEALLHPRGLGDFRVMVARR